MKESKMSRRNFLKAGALASAVGMMAAAPVAANAAAPTAVQAEDEENGMLDVFGKKPKYVFLFIGDGMGTAQIQSARFYQGTATNNGAVTEAELSFHLRQHFVLPGFGFHRDFHRHRPQDRERRHQHVPLDP